jgi:uncharacterized delta-60 repeat protein
MKKLATTLDNLCWPWRLSGMLLLGLVIGSRGQTLDSFNPRANATVNTMAAQTDGKIIVGGAFTSLGGQKRNYIGRLNPDGSLDGSFDPGCDGEVKALAVQPDNKILVGGSLSTIGGAIRNGLARLNPDGSLDIGFRPEAKNSIGSGAVS